MTDEQLGQVIMSLQSHSALGRLNIAEARVVFDRLATLLPGFSDLELAGTPHKAANMQAHLTGVIHEKIIEAARLEGDNA